MKKINLNIFYFFSRIIPGLVLLYAGLLKYKMPIQEIMLSIDAYKIFPSYLLFIISKTMPMFEIYLGVFLIFGLYNKYIIKLSIIIFVSFEFLLLQAIIRKLDILNCGCFGASHSNSITTEFLLNLIWLFFLFLSSKKGNYLSLDSFLDKENKK